MPRARKINMAEAGKRTSWYQWGKVVSEGLRAGREDPEDVEVFNREDAARALRSHLSRSGTARFEGEEKKFEGD